MLAVAPTPPRIALVPNAIAFRDPRHGLMGTGYQPCADPNTRCRPQGTVSITSDDGSTWRVLFRTPRPVVFVSYAGGQEWARFDDGEMLTSTDRGLHWRPEVPSNAFLGTSSCPLGWATHDNTGDRNWSVCTTQGSAGAMGKAVYHVTRTGWKRLAYTQFPPPGASVGGLSLSGYPLGISMADDGFGLIWEDRGTLYVTRDGGAHWTGSWTKFEPDVDNGLSASVLPGGVGFYLNQRGGQTLYETTDAGRNWRVVHVWK